jgi:cell division protease FtsH
MGGATFALPEKDRTIFTKRYCMALLQVCFGGRIAEEIFCDDISSGAQSDITQATRIARQMVLTWGMSGQLGPISYGPDLASREQGYMLPMEKEYSEKTAETIDNEVRKITEEALTEAKELIKSNKNELEKIAKALLKYETLDADDVELILKGGELDKPTVSDLLAAEQAKQEQPAEKTDQQPAEKTDQRPSA